MRPVIALELPDCLLESGRSVFFHGILEFFLGGTLAQDAACQQ
jgi:hypothetical protein